MSLPTKSLMDLMNKALASTGSCCTSVADFITDGEKSQDFIDDLMWKNTTLYFPSKVQPFLPTSILSKVYRYPQERARHIAISFLFGMVLSEFGGFYASLPEVLNRGNDAPLTKAALAQRMWLITSLSHDTGYSLKSKLSDSNLVFKTEYPRFLLTDTYNDPQMGSINNFRQNYRMVFAHKYKHILAYNDYIREYKDWPPAYEKTITAFSVVWICSTTLPAICRIWKHATEHRSWL